MRFRGARVITIYSLPYGRTLKSGYKLSVASKGCSLRSYLVADRGLIRSQVEVLLGRRYRSQGRGLDEDWKG